MGEHKVETLKYELYLDESGNFEDDDLKKGFTPSFVGGILVHSHVMTQKVIDGLISVPVHAMDTYRKEEFLGIIEKLKGLGGRIVLFENNERVHIVDGDTTYLNIITEGLTKLLRDLHNESPQAKIEINILIATRQNSEEREKGNKVRIMAEEYIRRFEEKMYVSLGRNKIDHVLFNISFGQALKDKRLMFADIVCNTWLTRKGKVKFTSEDRKRISSLYEDRIHYEVYEDPDAGYLRRLISENRIGEAVAQLCAHPKMKRNLQDTRDILMERIIKEYSKDRELYFRYMSLKIGQFNRRRDYAVGIQFAECYEERILTSLLELKETHDVAEYWMFDTDFYLLTMYDHIGNADKCTEYYERCNSRIGVASHSWEHIDYYFNFRIRELNRLIGQFDFESVLIKSEPLIEALQSAKELFSIIDPSLDKDNSLQSETLGKVYGVRLEAYTNLLHDHPECYEKALETSDLALAEFSKPFDLHRQYQYRCLMFVTAGKVEEALEALLQAYELEYSETVFPQFIEKVFLSGTKADVFALMHYTNVMLLMKKNNDKRAEKMKMALMANQRFVNEAKAPTEDDYPWNLILWNVGKYLRMEGSKKAADDYIEKALALTTKHKTEKTMYSFALCIASDRLNWETKNGSTNVATYRKQYDKLQEAFMKMDLPDTMRQWFSRDPGDMVALK